MKKLSNPSQEFWFTEHWVKEAKDAGFIKKFIYEADMPSFTLFEGLSKFTKETKTVYKGTKREETRELTHEFCMLKPTTYTPDGAIVWTDKAYHVLFAGIDDPIHLIKDCYFTAKKVKGQWVTILDVKAPTGTNRHSDTPFSFTRKWMWQQHEIFVNKVMLAPTSKSKRGYLFADTWTPGRYLWTDKLTSQRKLTNYNPILIKDFLLP